jgi:hypothetical protein
MGRFFVLISRLAATLKHCYLIIEPKARSDSVDM